MPHSISQVPIKKKVDCSVSVALELAATKTARLLESHLSKNEKISIILFH